MRATNLIGQRFGRLVVISQLPSKKYNWGSKARWLCQCDCGKTTEVTGRSLRVGHTKSCKCYQIDKQRGRPFGWVYTRLLHNAKKVNRICEISYEDFLGFTKINLCHYCGEVIDWAPYQVNDSTARYYLDRKDNSVGYTKDNCVVCCPFCNIVKGKTLTHDEMLLLGDGLRKIQEKRKST